MLQVFIYGGVGPLPSDVTVAGVAKAFGVRMVCITGIENVIASILFCRYVMLIVFLLSNRLIQAPDEDFEEYLRHLIGEKCTGDRNEVISHESPNVPEFFYISIMW